MTQAIRVRRAERYKDTYGVDVPEKAVHGAAVNDNAHTVPACAEAAREEPARAGARDYSRGYGRLTRTQRNGWVNVGLPVPADRQPERRPAKWQTEQMRRFA